MGESGDKQLIQQLSRTSLYRDCERAVSAVTGMPLALRGVEYWQMALHGKENENPFCALMAQTNGSCAACLEVQQKIGEGATGLTFTDYLSRGADRRERRTSS